MTIKACSITTKRKNVGDIYETMRHLSEDHPQIQEIINQVNASGKICNDDKRLIEKELLAMATVLYDVTDYTLVIGKWAGMWGASTYSYDRMCVAKEEKTVVNETLYTIVSYGKSNDWAAYVDLPIEVSL